MNLSRYALIILGATPFLTYGMDDDHKKKNDFIETIIQIATPFDATNKTVQEVYREILRRIAEKRLSEAK